MPDPKTKKIHPQKFDSGSSSSLWDLLCVSVCMGPPIHRLAAKLEDLRASLSLTSSSTLCRSRDASDWDSSSKSPARFKEILSLSITAPAGSISLNSHHLGSYEKVCGRSTPPGESHKAKSGHSYYWHVSFSQINIIRFYYIPPRLFLHWSFPSLICIFWHMLSCVWINAKSFILLFKKLNFFPHTTITVHVIIHTHVCVWNWKKETLRF